jgi:hypothetical protein
MYTIFAKLGDGELVFVASRDQVAQAVELMEQLKAYWPGNEYVLRDWDGRGIELVTAILDDLVYLAQDAALKIPLAELGDTRQHVRSALNRAVRKSNRKIATATDEDFQYVWRVARPD